MQEIQIGTTGLLSFFIGGIASYLLTRYVILKNTENELRNLRLKKSEYEESIKINKNKINEYEKQIKSLSAQQRENTETRMLGDKTRAEEKAELYNEIGELKKQLITKDAEWKNKLADERLKAFEEGKELALADYKIICTPFCYYNDSFFSKHIKGGYRFQLMVKGIPAFQPAEVLLEERKEFNQEVRTAILKSVNAAVDVLETSLNGGIPLQKLPMIQEQKKKSSNR